MKHLKYVWYSLVVTGLVFLSGCSWDWSRWPWSAE